MIWINRADLVFENRADGQRNTDRQKNREQYAPESDVKIETRAHLTKMSILVTVRTFRVSESKSNNRASLSDEPAFAKATARRASRDRNRNGRECGGERR